MQNVSSNICLAAAALLISLSPAAAQTQAAPPADSAAEALKAPSVLHTQVSFSDTIPEYFFNIVENLGLNSAAVKLIARFQSVPEDLILQALAKGNREVNQLRANAYTVFYAIQLFCQRDSLWNAFFTDIDLQFREPNIMIANFRNDQKGKSYALNDLFYSTFFQELLLSLGNIGIPMSRDGKQWLEGWPDELRWKYREYSFEYLPESMAIRVLGVRGAAGDTGVDQSSTVRLLPNKPVLQVEPGDTVEPPLRVP